MENTQGKDPYTQAQKDEASRVTDGNLRQVLLHNIRLRDLMESDRDRFEEECYILNKTIRAMTNVTQDFTTKRTRRQLDQTLKATQELCCRPTSWTTLTNLQEAARQLEKARMWLGRFVYGSTPPRSFSDKEEIPSRQDPAKSTLPLPGDMGDAVTLLRHLIREQEEELALIAQAYTNDPEHHVSHGIALWRSWSSMVEASMTLGLVLEEIGETARERDMANIDNAKDCDTSPPMPMESKTTFGEAELPDPFNNESITME